MTRARVSAYRRLTRLPWVACAWTGCLNLIIVTFSLASAAYGQASYTYEVVKSFDAQFPDGARLVASLMEAADGSFYGTTQEGGAFNRGTVFKLDAAGTLTTLHNFTGGADGRAPWAGITQATDGTFYGTTAQGGAFNYGTVFKLDAAGALTTVHSFTGYPEGGFPQAAITQATDGSFYGTTQQGGLYFRGTVFRLDAAGTLTTLKSFTGGADGGYPRAEITQAVDGSFYGTTSEGGASGRGTVFKLDSVGTHTTLTSFTGGADGGYPYAGVIQATDGSFYGTTYQGGASGVGTVFRLDAAGTLTTLKSFTGGTDGGNPYARVTQASDGTLYGTTNRGGAYGRGTVFKLDAGGTLTTLRSFTGGSDGGNPYAGVIQATDGSLYGTTTGISLARVGTVFKLDAAGTLTTLKSFTSGADGAEPHAGIIQASDGSFYGTTQRGGAFNRGTVFRLDGTGTTILKSFTGGADGGDPSARLIQATDGSFYGTTFWGGAAGGGTVFKLDAAGTLTTLKSFTGGADGGYPYAGLIQASDGSFYGTTSQGGASGAGTVFRLDAAGTLTTLRSFTGGADGGYPYAGLIQASDGSFYGTTYQGGVSGAGTVFRLDAAGTLTTLKSFTGGADGRYPYAGITQATDGSFYGTTTGGGAFTFGTLFKLDAGGTLTTLKSFTAGSDGATPQGGVIQASDGSFYGTTYQGGAAGRGTVFRLDASGALTTLKTFNASDGESPIAGVTQAADGSFYGTTQRGGAANAGTVFRLTPVSNRAPVANGQAIATLEDTSRAITLSAADADADALAFSVLSGPTHGTLTGAAPSLTYTPVANYHGPDSFTFTANDGTVDSNVATVSFTIAPVNDAPIAQAGPDAVVDATSASGSQVSLTGSGSSDVDGDALTFAWTWPAGSAGGATPVVQLPVGVTTVTLTVSDGQATAVDTVAIRVRDTTPPMISCGAADNVWHSTDVSIACTASDGESGLANAVDANFSLTTNVPIGSETISASTNSRLVCNTEGLCAVGGPISSNKVDKKAPTITITSPANATYLLNARVAARYFCPEAGAGLTLCQGPVNNFGSIDTSSTGNKAFTVTATDAVGNVSTIAVAYMVAPAEAGTWSLTALMSGARWDHTATTLADGRVLVSGGERSTGRLASAEVYDPALGTWSLMGSMSTARQLHTATLLADGRVLVSGGYTGSSVLSGAEIFDPALGSWSAAGSMSIARAWHTANLLPDGRVLISGGVGDSFQALGTAEIYDPALGIWSPTASMSSARYFHTATGLADGQVLVAGGNGAGGSVELYDPATGIWSPTASMSTARYGHTATLLADGRTLVSGGVSGSGHVASAEIYDPAPGTWSLTGSMSGTRYTFTATRLPDGRVLASGGSGNVGNLAGAEIYDPAVGTWSLTSSMSTERVNHNATALADGRVLVSGGLGPINSAELYSSDPTPPQVSCGAADAFWHDTDVTIACTASDPQSGLANPADASFTLATSVAPGTETADAVTNNRRVCNAAGTCTTVGPITGNKVDKKAPTIACGNADTTWHTSDVTVACAATDGGSGLANAADASFSLTTSVPAGTETASAATNSRQVCDALGACRTAGPVTGHKVDKKPPTVACGSPDGVWHNSDVTATCTAIDAGSGLANAADSSFTLTTSVPAGTETATAPTNSRQVCDTAGTCTAAGPITGNKVDKKAPTISISSPTPSGTYQLNASVAANYACGDMGAGVASCQGSVANGALIDTSSTGTKTFTVTAMDTVGNSSPLTVTYNVVSGGGGGSTSADLGITLAVATKVVQGGTLTYTIQVTNGGKAAASGVVVSNALPTGTVFASANASQGTISAPAVGSNGTVTVNLSGLANGTRATVNIVASVTAAVGTVLTDSATVSATTQDLNTANNSATQKTTVSKK